MAHHLWETPCSPKRCMNCSDSSNTYRMGQTAFSPLSQMSNTLLLTKILGKAQTLWSPNLHHLPANNSNMWDVNQVPNPRWIDRTKAVTTISISTLCSPASIQVTCMPSNMKNKYQVPRVHALPLLRESMSNTLTAIKTPRQLVDGWLTKPSNLILHSIAIKVENRKPETPSSREISAKPNSVSLSVKCRKMSTQSNFINQLNQVRKHGKRLRALQPLRSRWRA